MTIQSISRERVSRASRYTARRDELDVAMARMRRQDCWVASAATSARRSGATTSTISAMFGARSKMETLWASSGKPANGAQKGSNPPESRAPLPLIASKTAPVRRVSLGAVTGATECRMSIVRRLRGAGTPGWSRIAGSLLLRMRKNHATGNSLEHAGHGDIHGVTHVGTATLDDDHGPVVEIANTLPNFFAVLHNLDRHVFARQQDGLDGMGKLIDIEHLDALQLRDTIEVEVVGDDGTVPLPGQLDQLGVHLVNRFGIGVADLDRNGRFFLEPLQDLQAAPATLAAHTVGGIGDMLQLFEDEARHNQRANDESGLANIGDAAIYDGAGIHENTVTCASILASSEAVAQAAVIFALLVPVGVALLAESEPARAASGEGTAKEAGEVVFTQHRYRDARVGPEYGIQQRQPLAEVHKRNLGQENRTQGGDAQTDDKTDGRGNEVADLGAPNLLAGPAVKHRDEEEGERQYGDEDSGGDAGVDLNGEMRILCGGCVIQVEKHCQPDTQRDEQPDEAGNVSACHTVLRSGHNQTGWPAILGAHPVWYAPMPRAVERITKRGCVAYAAQISAI